MGDIATVGLNETDRTKQNFAIRQHAQRILSDEDAIGVLNAVNIKTFGAKGDGTTDDRAAFVAAEAAYSPDDIDIPIGVYFVGSSISLNSRYRFRRGAVLKPSTGVTITFNTGVDAGDYKIFDTSIGSIAGLQDVNVEWFTSRGNAGTDCVVEVQKAYDACAYGARVRWAAKVYSFDGGTPVVVSKGQATRGRGSGSTFIRWLTASRNAFRFETAAFPGFSGFNLDSADASILPAAGIALDCPASFARLNDFVINNGWFGLKWNGGTGGRAHDFDINFAAFIGVYSIGGNDWFIDNFTISAVADVFTFSPMTGTFLSGETINFSDGSTGTIIQVLSSSKYLIATVYFNPAAGVTGTGVTSAAHGTLSVILEMHQLGGIRLEGSASAFTASNGDVIGGKFSMTVANVSASQPRWNKFTNVFFDTSKNGLSMSLCSLFMFVNCWLSSHGTNAVTTLGTQGLDFIGCHVVNNRLDGFNFSATCSNWGVHSSQIAQNGNNGITVASGGSKFRVLGNDFTGLTLTPAPVPVHDLSVGAACVAFIASNNIGTTGKLQDASTTTNKIISENIGWP